MSSLLLPRWSERTPTGNEKRIPASGETAATRPMTMSLAPRACENRGRTGFFESVVEKIAKKPIRERMYIARRSGTMERVPFMVLSLPFYRIRYVYNLFKGDYSSRNKAGQDGHRNPAASRFFSSSRKPAPRRSGCHPYQRPRKAGRSDTMISCSGTRFRKPG